MGCPTPGRFDVLGTDPLKLIDACHNPQSCENFVSALDEIDPYVENRPTLLCAALADRETVVHGAADAADVQAMCRCLRALGRGARCLGGR